MSSRGSSSLSAATNNLKPFLFGGLASCVAEACTFPIDTAKTRLQLQGQRMGFQDIKPYSGVLDCWRRVISEEGFTVLYRGLSPALLRQASYGTIKFGLYYTIKEYTPGPESSLKNVVSAVVAGSVSSAIANPTDVLKVRMQSRQKMGLVTSSGVFSCFRDIYRYEGVLGLWRGVTPTAQRAAVVAGVQLPVYDFVKLFFLRNEVLADGACNHLISSFCAGLSACLASNPMDVVRTRMMNQRKLRRLAENVPANVIESHHHQIYRSSAHCAIETVRCEGFLALYKGFVPSFMRMGPWNIIFFLVYERLKLTFNPVSLQEDSVDNR